MNNVTHNTFWQWPSAISSEECDLIIKSAQDGKWEPATIQDRGVDPDKRETDIKWLDIMSPVGCIMQAYINAANHYAGWMFDLRYMEKVQLGKYSEEKESFYDWHTDMDRPDSNEEQRKLTVVLLLSDPKEYEGGKLEFKECDKEQNKKILPTKGSLLVFPSFIDHRVTPVTKGTRYSAVTWMVGPKLK